MKPIVAIIGRPNVGKSTLFNHLIRKKLSVTDDIPGVTRDRNYAETDWNGRQFILVDTGGLVPKAQEGIEKAIRLQAEAAIEEADLVLFITDVQTGITTEDEEITNYLLKAKKNSILVVNKVDTYMHEGDYYDFYKLGFENTLHISATAGRCIGDLLDKVVELLPESKEDEEIEGIKVAVVGRPNVGKSSFINSLVGKERVIVDSKPGTTRDSTDTIYEYQGQKYILIDTAGLRKKPRITDGIEYYSSLRTLRSIDRCDVALLLLDAKEGITKQDAKIAEYALSAFKGIVIAANKWDLVEKDDKTYLHFQKEVEINLPFATFAPVVYISALTKQRIIKAVENIYSVYNERKKRIPTREFNEFIEGIVNYYHPPSLRGRETKIYFATQHQAEPPTFVFFVNYPKAITENYSRYIVNKIRERFGFTGVPIKIVVKRRKKKKKG